MHIWLKTSERLRVDPRVMKEGIDENHPWVTDDGRGYTCTLLEPFIDHNTANYPIWWWIKMKLAASFVLNGYRHVHVYCVQFDEETIDHFPLLDQKSMIVKPIYSLVKRHQNMDRHTVLGLECCFLQLLWGVGTENLPTKLGTNILGWEGFKFVQIRAPLFSKGR